ncbi:beta-crystallin B2-like [Argopecten irradians]|uniref:beta-crystallin B2-like n=1 Tax=Argopecten irradians TaxID=31199 RepID=UPI00371DBDC3
MPAPSPLNTPLITIYDKPDCKGALMEVVGPMYDLAVRGFRKVPSVMVTRGVWVLYQECNLGGNIYVVWEGQTVNLPEFCTVSLKPIEVDFTEKPEMIVYTEPSFTGQKKTFKTAVANLAGINFHDNISSVKVESGAWVAYRDVNYQGPQYLFTRGAFNGTSSEGHFQNNAISSLKPIALSYPC